MINLFKMQNQNKQEENTLFKKKVLSQARDQLKDREKVWGKPRKSVPSLPQGSCFDSICVCCIGRRAARGAAGSTSLRSLQAQGRAWDEEVLFCGFV